MCVIVIDVDIVGVVVVVVVSCKTVSDYSKIEIVLSAEHVAFTVGAKKEFGVCCALLRRIRS
jgi:hypothetical protein